MQSALCTKCGYEWDYTGNSTRRTACPRCNKNVMLNSKTPSSKVLDLELLGRILEKCIKNNEKKVILDCEGQNVVSVNTI